MCQPFVIETDYFNENEENTQQLSEDITIILRTISNQPHLRSNQTLAASIVSKRRKLDAKHVGSNCGEPNSRLRKNEPFDSDLGNFKIVRQENSCGSKSFCLM